MVLKRDSFRVGGVFRLIFCKTFLSNRGQKKFIIGSLYNDQL